MNAPDHFRPGLTTCEQAVDQGLDAVGNDHVSLVLHEHPADPGGEPHQRDQAPENVPGSAVLAAEALRRAVNLSHQHFDAKVPGPIDHWPVLGKDQQVSRPRDRRKGQPGH